jgi:hypothetical protein
MERLNCKMVGTARFVLDEPDQGAHPTSPVVTVEAAPREPGTQQHASDIARPVPAPPQLPYSPNPGMYGQRDCWHECSRDGIGLRNLHGGFQREPRGLQRHRNLTPGSIRGNGFPNCADRKSSVPGALAWEIQLWAP